MLFGTGLFEVMQKNRDWITPAGEARDFEGIRTWGKKLYRQRQLNQVGGGGGLGGMLP